MIFIYTTFPNKTEAEKISEGLVKAHLAACINIWPIFSIYRWQGKLEKEREYAGLIKTGKKNFKAVEQFIRKRHDYEVPCIAALSITTTSKEYRQWVMSCVRD